MKWIATVALLVTVASVGSPGSNAELVFKRRGEVVKTLPLDGLAALAPPEDMKVREPHDGLEKTYRGYPLAKLFSAVYGEKWKESEEVLFTCADGYKPSLPVAGFREHKSLLAFAITGEKSFSLQNKANHNEHIELGPLYLVWNNLADAGLKSQEIWEWPYQIVSIDLIRFRDKFPHMAPPAGSSAAVSRGFLGFRRYCVFCHTINGEGGGKAPELNYPVSVTEYIDGKYLMRWIKEPRSVRYGSTMPDFSSSEKDPQAVIRDIVAYLKAMAGRKVAPKPAAPVPKK